MPDLPDRPEVSRSEPSLLAACHRRRPDHTPVWFMRQAGRSLPEYRALREGVAMLDACSRPELIVEITLQPVRRHGVDAAILFSDIVVPLRAIGVDLDIVPGTGPVIAEPVRSAREVERLRPLQPDDVAYVAEAVRGLVGELGDTPLIGFAGAPFTLASYLVEGGPSRDQARTKALMHSDPVLWHDLLGRLAVLSAEFLRVQVAAGARAVQLFDSWAGTLSAADYASFVQPHSAAVLAAIGDTAGRGGGAQRVPRIHFGVGTGELLALMGEAGADVVGVDWRVPLGEATRRVGPGRALQGNLDPAILQAPWPVVEAATKQVLAQGASAPGHVFNLGHGVPPDTDPGVLTRVVELVHGSTRSAG